MLPQARFFTRVLGSLLSELCVLSSVISVLPSLFAFLSLPLRFLCELCVSALSFSFLLSLFFPSFSYSRRPTNLVIQCLHQGKDHLLIKF
jgi:hypothetical protein